MTVVGDRIVRCVGNTQCMVVHGNIRRKIHITLLDLLNVGMVVFMLLLGFIFDQTGNYNIPFFAGGAVEIIGGCLVLVAAAIHGQRREK